MKFILTQKPVSNVNGNGTVKDTLSQTAQNIRKDSVITALVEDDKVSGYVAVQTATGRVCHVFDYSGSFKAEVSVVPFAATAIAA